MAHYETTVHSPMRQRDEFDVMADTLNFERWDPGIKSTRQVERSGLGIGAACEIKMSATTLRYMTVQRNPPCHSKFETHATLLSSYDTIEVTDALGGGPSVRCEAVVEFADPLFAIMFQRSGDKVAVGMAVALGGNTRKWQSWLIR